MKKQKEEEVIDFTKPEKIEDQELNDLQSTVRTMDKLADDIGRMEIQKYALMKALDSTQSRIGVLRTTFLEKYGTDNINIQTGEIGYPEESTKENGQVNS
jgi:hypothetical protein